MCGAKVGHFALSAKYRPKKKCAIRTIGIFPRNVREKPFARHTICRNFAAEIRKKKSRTL